MLSVRILWSFWDTALTRGVSILLLKRLTLFYWHRHPKNQQELRSFLGLVQYYRKFIPNLSTLVHPLNELLKAGKSWRWTPDCKSAFTAAKEKLSQAPILAHFDPAVPLRLAGDASAYGIGAVLSHLYHDGTERPIAYASRTLTSSERNYTQLEKEALSLVFGIKKFHPYIYGREFQLLTDHKPLTTILGPKAGIPSLAAARLQRWALLLSSYPSTRFSTSPPRHTAMLMGFQEYQ